MSTAPEALIVWKMGSILWNRYRDLGWDCALCHERFQSMIIMMPSAWNRMIFNASLQREAPKHKFRNIGAFVLCRPVSRGDLQWMLFDPRHLLSCRSCLQVHWAQFTFSGLDGEKQGMLLPKRFSFLYGLADFRLVQLLWACAQNLRSHTVAISTNTFHSASHFSPPSNTAHSHGISQDLTEDGKFPSSTSAPTFNHPFKIPGGHTSQPPPFP